MAAATRDPAAVSTRLRVNGPDAVGSTGARIVLGRFDADCGDNGPLTLLRVEPETVLTVA